MMRYYFSPPPFIGASLGALNAYKVILNVVATLDYSPRKEFDSSQQKLENFAFISNYHLSGTMLSAGLKNKKKVKQDPTPAPCNTQTSFGCSSPNAVTKGTVAALVIQTDFFFLMGKSKLIGGGEGQGRFLQS